ncbi:MAG TPA: hypothetical protein VEA36_00695 [Candidatus Paceibacterota bacterium]|nr:hypothetical protein [Candidatus Paceibacterota bacterium]
MDGNVVFDSERDPTLMRRSSGQKAGVPLGELITPGPQKDKKQTDKVVLGILGLVLMGSVYVAINTRPKEIVVLTPADAPVINPAIIKP